MVIININIPARLFLNKNGEFLINMHRVQVYMKFHEEKNKENY